MAAFPGIELWLGKAGAQRAGQPADLMAVLGGNFIELGSISLSGPWGDHRRNRQGLVVFRGEGLVRRAWCCCVSTVVSAGRDFSATRILSRRL